MIRLVLSTLMVLSSCLCSPSQNVVRQGNTFTQVSAPRESKATKTQYTYKAKDGKVYPIYVSQRGKAFVIKTSKSGKQYRQYLPDVTAQLAKK